MADFEQLKASVASIIKTNGAEAITGAVLQNVLLTMINSISDGYMFGGVAQHSGSVGNPDYNVFYLGGSGSYTGYGGSIDVPAGSYCVFAYDGAWHQSVIDLGISLGGTVSEGETQGVTGDAVNSALNTLWENITNILDSIEFSDDTSELYKGDRIMQGMRVTAGGVERLLSSFTILAATAAKAGLMSAADKRKLDNFVFTVQDMIETMTVSDVTGAGDTGTRIDESIEWTVDEVTHQIATFTLLAATAVKAGLMSNTDKQAVDALFTIEAEDTTAVDDLGVKLTETLNWTVNNVSQIFAEFTLLAATQSKAGLMSAADKAKLDAYENNIRSMEIVDTTGNADKGDQITETLRWVFGGVSTVITTFTLLAATHTKAGLMSAVDKQLVDALLTIIAQDTTAQADEKASMTQSLKWTRGGTQQTMVTFSILAATAAKAGLMSADDKAKLDAMLTGGYMFAGVATTSTNPTTGTEKMFYIAVEAGEYTHFDGLTVDRGINILMYDGSDWNAVTVVGIDERPTKDSSALVGSGGVFDATNVPVKIENGCYLQENGTVNETSADSFSVSDYYFTVVGTKIVSPIGTTSNLGSILVCFYDEDMYFISSIAGEYGTNPDITLSSENIPEGAVYFRATIRTGTGYIATVPQSFVEKFIEEKNLRKDDTASVRNIFNIPRSVVRPTSPYAVESSTTDYATTTLINVDDFDDGAIVKCVVGPAIGIVGYNASKEPIGIYSDYASVSSIRTVTFKFDKSHLPSGTQYVRFSTKTAEMGYISGLRMQESYHLPENGYTEYLEDRFKFVSAAVTYARFDFNFFDYYKVVLRRIGGYNDLTDRLAIYFYTDENTYTALYIYANACLFNNHKLFYNKGKVAIEIDYDILGRLTEIHSSSDLCVFTKKSFVTTEYAKQGAAYVESTSHASIAESFTNVRYESDEVLDVTVQRFPATEDVFVEDTNEYFCFYVWDGATKLKAINCYVRDAQISGTVITYESSIISFTVDYSICGTVSKVATPTKTDIALTENCFVSDNELGHLRIGEFKGKKYANISSSTFSSFQWHQSTVEKLGFEYTNFGMGGACHRPYNNAKFNLNYQDKTEPTADRNILNQVAKICTEYLSSGYYPDVIASCCVLNDCYTNAIPVGTDPATKIGSAEEAMAATLPQLDLTSAQTIEDTFSAFFDSDSPDVVAVRGNSMKMMRLSFELLMQRFPFAQIIICSCQQVTSDSFNQEAITLFNQEQKKLAQLLAIPYIDINGECGINQITASTFLRDDHLHPNAAGQTVYSNYMIEKLNSEISFRR